MRCQKCGNEIENLFFCPICDSKNSTGHDESSFSKPQNKFSKILSSLSWIFLSRKFLISISVMILLSLSLVFAYRNADLILPSKTYYLLVEYKNSTLTPKNIAKNYTLLIDKIRNFGNFTASSKKLTFSPTINITSNPSSDSMDKTLSQISDIVNKLKISTMFDNNIKDKKNMVKIDLSLKDTHIIELDLIRINELFSIYCPEIYKKYLVFDASMAEDGEELTKFINNYNSLNSLSTEDIINSIDLDEKKVQSIVQRYLDILVDSLPKDNFQIKRDVIIDDEEGGQISAKEIIIDLKGEDLKKIITSLYDSMASDTMLKSTVTNTLKNLIKVCKDKKASEEYIKELEKSLNYLEKNWAKDIEKNKKELAESTYSPSCVIHTYVDSWGNIMERKLVETPDKSSDNKLIYDYKNLKTSKGTILTMFSAEEFGDQPNRLKFTHTRSYPHLGTVAINYKNTLLEYNTHMTYQKASSELSDFGIPLGSYTLVLKNSNKDNLLILSLGVESISGKEQKYSYNLKGKANSNYKFGLNITSEKVSAGDIKYPDFNKDPSVYFSKMNDAQKQELYMEVQKGAMELSKSLAKISPESEILKNISSGLFSPFVPREGISPYGTINSYDSAYSNDSKIEMYNSSNNYKPTSSMDDYNSSSSYNNYENSSNKPSANSSDKINMQAQDIASAKLVEKGINSLIKATKSTDFHKMSAYKGSKTLNKMAVAEFIKALQSPIYYNGKTYNAPLGKSSTNYRVQWTSQVGGKNIGYKIFIDKKKKQAWCKPMTSLKEIKIVFN